MRPKVVALAMAVASAGGQPLVLGQQKCRTVAHKGSGHDSGAQLCSNTKIDSELPQNLLVWESGSQAVGWQVALRLCSGQADGANQLGLGNQGAASQLDDMAHPGLGTGGILHGVHLVKSSKVTVAETIHG